MSSNLQIRKTCLFCGCGFIAKTTVTQYFPITVRSGLTNSASVNLKSKK